MVHIVDGLLSKNTMLSQQFLNGLSLDSIDTLIILGYTMVYGMLEFINFARGEICMIGAYLAIIVMGLLSQWGLNIMTVAPMIVILLSAAFGAAIEKISYKPLRNAPRPPSRSAPWGVPIFLQKDF